MPARIYIISRYRRAAVGISAPPQLATSFNCHLAGEPWPTTAPPSRFRNAATMAACKKHLPLPGRYRHHPSGIRLRTPLVARASRRPALLLRFTRGQSGPVARLTIRFDRCRVLRALGLPRLILRHAGRPTKPFSLPDENILKQARDTDAQPNNGGDHGIHSQPNLPRVPQ
jgi:hypothetical protein